MNLNGKKYTRKLEKRVWDAMMKNGEFRIKICRMYASWIILWVVGSSNSSKQPQLWPQSHILSCTRTHQTHHTIYISKFSSIYYKSSSLPTPNSSQMLKGSVSVNKNGQTLPTVTPIHWNEILFKKSQPKTPTFYIKRYNPKSSLLGF